MEVVTDKSVIITLAIPVFFLLIIVEYVYGRMIGKNTYRLNDTITSITIHNPQFGILLLILLF